MRADFGLTSACITTIHIRYNLFLAIIRATYKPIKSTLYSAKEISFEKVTSLSSRIDHGNSRQELGTLASGGQNKPEESLFFF
jgi:hypothetical protein